MFSISFSNALGDCIGLPPCLELLRAEAILPRSKTDFILKSEVRQGNLVQNAETAFLKKKLGFSSPLSHEPDRINREFTDYLEVVWLVEI